MTSGVVKSSTVLISSGSTQTIYRSLDDVPAPLKQQLAQSTNSPQSETIVMADRRGRREIAKVVDGGVEEPAVVVEQASAPSLSRRWMRSIALVLAIVAGLLIWHVFRR